MPTDTHKNLAGGIDRKSSRNNIPKGKSETISNLRPHSTGKLETRSYMGYARAKIWSGLARLNYMLEYYLKNYKQNTIKAG